MNWSPLYKLLPHPQQSPRSTLILNSNQTKTSGGVQITLQVAAEDRLDVTTPLNKHGAILNSACPHIWHPLWPRKVEIIIWKIINYSLLLLPYLYTIYKTVLQCIFFLFNNLVKKMSASRRGWRGYPQLLTQSVLFIMIRKLTPYTIPPLWNFSFTSIMGNCLSFRCQSGILGRIYPPSTRRKNLRRLSPFLKIQPQCGSWPHI